MEMMVAYTEVEDEGERGRLETRSGRGEKRAMGDCSGSVWTLISSSNMRSHQRSPVVGDIDAIVGSGALAGEARMFGWIGDAGTVWGGCKNDRLKVESL